MVLPVDAWIRLSALLFLLSLGVILPLVRRDYLRHGGLSHLGAFLQLVVWFAFHVFLALVVWGDLWPSVHETIPRNWIGALPALPGLGLCLAGMGAFRSLKKIFGQEANRLVTSGVYHWTRNPQYTGYGLMLVGIVLAYWSSTAWLVLPAYALLVGATVRIEEEHLEAVFGEGYRAYCRQVPRFIGIGRLEE